MAMKRKIGNFPHGTHIQIMPVRGSGLRVTENHEPVTLDRQKEILEGLGRHVPHHGIFGTNRLSKMTLCANTWDKFLGRAIVIWIEESAHDEKPSTIAIQSKARLAGLGFEAKLEGYIELTRPTDTGDEILLWTESATEALGFIRGWETFAQIAESDKKRQPRE